MNSLLAREMQADRLAQAERARARRATVAPAADGAAIDRQRARVRLSLILLPRRRGPGAEEGR